MSLTIRKLNFTLVVISGVMGLVTQLDYFYSMGVQLIFISETMFLNMIWEADSTSNFEKSVSQK